MPPITITTPNNPIRVQRLAAELSAKIEEGTDGTTKLRVGPDVSTTDIQALLRRLRPLRIEVLPSSSIVGIILDLGNSVVIDSTTLLRVPAPWRSHAFAAQLPISGPIRFVNTRAGAGRRSALAALIVTAIMPQADWTVTELDGELVLAASARVCSQIRPGLALELIGDETTLRHFQRHDAALSHEGWRIHRTQVETPVPTIEIWAPPGIDSSVAESLGAIIPIVRTALSSGLRAHVEPSLMIRLPHIAEDTNVNRGPSVRVRTDAPEDIDGFVNALKMLGIESVEVMLGLSFTEGFALRHIARARREAAIDDVERLITQQIESLGLSSIHLCNTTHFDELTSSATMEIDLPQRIAREGRLLNEILGSADRYSIKVANMTQPRALQRLLESALNAASAKHRHIGELTSRQEEYRIAIGGAPWELANVLAQSIRTATGIDLPIQRVWKAMDHDVWVSLPPNTQILATNQPTTVTSPRALTRTTDQTFLELDSTSLRVGSVVLHRHGGDPRAPALDSYMHTCLDVPTAHLLAHLALSVKLREPVLLEGPTAAGKTSTILYLAALLGQPVVRLNLSGQTDTGELIGRYAPSPNGWAWHEGVIPSAMRHGWWVILDEINIAEPAIIERINPVIERIPSLLVTEGDGTRFGPGGIPVAQGFHIFATMNPVDGGYSGRNCLSPALRDRFTAQLQCTAPSEADVRDLLMQLVHGYGPDVTVNTTLWKGATGLPAPHSVLALKPHINTFLSAFARFHTSIESAATASDPEQRLGGERREGLVVSRRVLLAVLDYLCWHETHHTDNDALLYDAIERYYVARSATEADRAAIRHLAHAAGIGRRIL